MFAQWEGDLEIGVQGVNLDALVIDKLSPIAVCVSASTFTTILLPHREAETMYTLSLQHVKIILGRTLMKN